MSLFHYFHTLSTCLLSLVTLSHVLAWQETQMSVRPPSREFRGAWVATVFNIDWPSRAGLSSTAQQAEINDILNKMESLHLNALILQIRPSSDAFYASNIEPWSQYLTGTQGSSPGYDPLQFTINLAHSKGIEVHAWFNPFRALCNPHQSTASNHIARSHPEVLRAFGSTVWSDPGHPTSVKQILDVISDVVKRYDIDGVHIDDYFYPYPNPGQTWHANQFNDQQTFQRYGSGDKLAWRRKNIDNFVEALYKQVKDIKPWVRVGISPFGIWKPGVPSGIEAGVDSYNQLSADSRKWLAKGWVDYLAPQLYWRCQPTKQSFPLLLKWWRDQSNSRPVFPGIATARIQSSEDPGRPASEIIQQINYTRQLAKGQNGMLFWSMKSLLQNKGGICQQLSQVFTAPTLTPAMPWCGATPPSKPKIFASDTSKGIKVYWKANDSKARKWIVQARYGQKWATIAVLPSYMDRVTLTMKERPSAISVRGICPYGSNGEPAVVVP